MQEQAEIFTKVSPVNLEVHSRDDKFQFRVMGGKGLFNSQEQRFTFVENPKRGKKSKLVRATPHATLRLRENGNFSISIVFEGDEKYVDSTLLSEVRELVKASKAEIEENAKKEKTKNAKEDNNKAQ